MVETVSDQEIVMPHILLRPRLILPNALKAQVRSENRRAARLYGLTTTITPEQWEDTLVRYGRRCALCSEDRGTLAIDHITPLAKGGAHVIENLQPLCKRCNSEKGSWKPPKGGVSLTWTVTIRDP